MPASPFPHITPFTISALLYFIQDPRNSPLPVHSSRTSQPTLLNDPSVLLQDHADDDDDDGGGGGGGGEGEEDAPEPAAKRSRRSKPLHVRFAENVMIEDVSIANASEELSKAPIVSVAQSVNAIKVRKRPAALTLVPAQSHPSEDTSPVEPSSRSVPASPIEMGGRDAASADSRESFRGTFRGTPRRRPNGLLSRAPSLPTLVIPPRVRAPISPTQAQSHQTPHQVSPQHIQGLSQDAPRPQVVPPSAWQDPSERVLTGNGSSLQHARSSYAQGPVEVLPGLYLGDEFNARDEQVLANRGITTILNVAKETMLPGQNDDQLRDLGYSILPPNAVSGRTWPINYYKLPWTHGEQDLASITSPGGFVTGCAIIGEALGVDPASGQIMKRTMMREDAEATSSASNPAGMASNGPKGGVLVHCQCGVSRSATMVIAFVMQAAAHLYDYAAVRDLLCMDDTYEYVKRMSSSISPNLPLIIQMKAWEQQLRAEVAELSIAVEEQGDDRHRTGSDLAAHVPLSAGHSSTSRERRRQWGDESPSEKDWMRMRADEELKEREEQELGAPMDVEMAPRRD